MIRMISEQLINHLDSRKTQSDAETNRFHLIFNPIGEGLARQSKSVFEQVAGVEAQRQVNQLENANNNEGVNRNADPFRVGKCFRRLTNPNTRSGEEEI